MEINTIQCLPREKCTGCASCANRCPLNCISMQGDEEGFLFPVIDESRCSRCGVCKASCPVLYPPEKANEENLPDCYAAWSKDEQIRFHSTSGGVFTHLAQAVLAQGGLVSGARYRSDHLVEHVLISNESDLEALRQSKYVQSETGLVYRAIQTQLQEDRPVLFVGTPCQCAGLKTFLGRDYSNLYLCDFICRGVNSPKIYLTYLHELEELYGSSVKQIWFKNKTYGWNHFCTKIIFVDGQEYLADRETDPFMLGYIKSRLNLYMRPSCYDCQFKGISRPTDVTLGDFWGIGSYMKNGDLDGGVSVVLLHTQKGRELFAINVSDLCISEQQASAVIERNVCMVESVHENQEQKKLFFKQLDKNENLFLKTMSEWTNNENR